MWFAELRPTLSINIFSLTQVLINAYEFEHAIRVCSETGMGGYLAPLMACINRVFVKGVEEQIQMKTQLFLKKINTFR